MIIMNPRLVRTGIETHAPVTNGVPAIFWYLTWDLSIRIDCEPHYYVDLVLSSSLIFVAVNYDG